MHIHSGIRCLALALALMMCVSCGASRDSKTWTVDVTMTIQLDEGFVAQQTGILTNIQTIRDDLEWKYNKGTVITKNVVGTILVVAWVAGAVILSKGNLPTETNADKALEIIIADKTCSTVYHSRFVKPGVSTIAFKAPAGEELYVFSSLGDIRYALHKLDTPADGGPLAAELRLVTSTLTVK